MFDTLLMTVGPLQTYESDHGGSMRDPSISRKHTEPLIRPIHHVYRYAQSRYDRVEGQEVASTISEMLLQEVTPVLAQRLVFSNHSAGWVWLNTKSHTPT